MYLTARRNGRGLKLWRRIQRSEGNKYLSVESIFIKYYLLKYLILYLGTYIAVENGTWIPFTMFIYCGVSDSKCYFVFINYGDFYKMSLLRLLVASRATN